MLQASWLKAVKLNKALNSNHTFCTTISDLKK